MNSPLILIVDDEVQIRKLLSITLTANDFRVDEVATGKDALARVANHPPDLVLLDLGLPDESGHEILHRLREWYTNPIIILSVQSSEEDIVKALDAGANDYLVKPFRTGELMARIRTALRHITPENNNPVINLPNLQIDLATRSVKKDNQLIKLTATEYALFSALVRNEGKVLTHQQLLRQVWGPSYAEQSQYLRVFIAQLRKKIEEDPNRPRHIITESGVGYRFIAT